MPEDMVTWIQMEGMLKGGLETHQRIPGVRCSLSPVLRLWGPGLRPHCHSGSNTTFAALPELDAHPVWGTLWPKGADGLLQAQTRPALTQGRGRGITAGT